MEGLNSPCGGNGPSPKRQRTQAMEEQGCSPQVNDSHEDLADHATKRHAAADIAPEAETEGGPQLSEGFDTMTETVKAGMFMIQSRTQAADAKVVKPCLSCTAGQTEIVLSPRWSSNLLPVNDANTLKTN